MTPRPGYTSKRRPLSAIFLGDPSNNPSPSNLPDLPEPPSPGADSAISSTSGLPSPPATNSTGSGGNKSTDGGSVRKRSVANGTADMPNGLQNPSSGSRSSRASTPGDDDGGSDEDVTARFSRRRSAQTSSENAAALQRVLSLTQRNRMALDKLSRLNTPSPSGRSSRSPLPPLTGPSSSASSVISSSRATAHTQPQSFPSAQDRDSGLSGSETERESQKHAYSSDEQSVTPPSTISNASSIRYRRVSLPNTPSRNRLTGNRTSSPGPSTAQQSSPRKRVSLMTSMDSEVAQAALAAVESMRRSPTLSAGRKNRQPLPREFLEATKSSSDGRVSKEPNMPVNLPSRAFTNSPSPRRLSTTTRDSLLQLSPRRTQPRFSTVRETSRKHQMRWQSEDLSVSGNEDDDINAIGRRQSHRSGSLENSLGTRLVGDSLRAAGIGVRKDYGDSLSPRQAQFNSSNVTETVSQHGIGDGRLLPTHARSSSVIFDPRTPVTTHNNLNYTRPATSMAEFNQDTAPRTAPPAIRTYTSAFLERNREGIGSSSAPRPSSQVSDIANVPLRAPVFAERTYGSTVTRRFETPSNSKTRRQATSTDDQSLEHLNLIADALSIFETQLSRLPPMGDTTTATVPELFRDAQTVVRLAEQGNNSLRRGTNHALERQIDAEVDEIDSGTVNMVQLWQDIGGDLREGLRSSDELVRTLANFLIGVSKVLREASTVSNAQSSQHFRTMSLDSGSAVVVNPSDKQSSAASSSNKSSARGSDKGLLDGRKSAESRRSWDVKRLELNRTSSRAEARQSLQLRERESKASRSPDLDPKTQSSASNRSHSSGFVPSSSMRRVYTLRDNAARNVTPAHYAPTLPSESSSEFLDQVDPSPTPPARQQAMGNPGERLRGLAPIAIPREINSLPSEKVLSKRISTTDHIANRRKQSTNSNVTVRAAPSFTVPPTPGATTALTPATASSNHTPDKMTFPIQRLPSETNLSSRKSSVSAVLSRATAASAFGRNRERTASIAASAGVTGGQVHAGALESTSRINSESESERSSSARITLGRRMLATSAASMRGPRASLDTPVREGRNSPSASQTVGILKKERRRTITEIFSS